MQLLTLIMQRVGNILRQFIRDYGLEGGLTLEKIKAEWVSLVGDTIAAHTCPQTMRGKTIFITVDTPQWMHHLDFYKQEILEKLKPYKVEEVRFKLGKLSENLGTELRTGGIYQPTEEDAQYIENTIRSIKDEELKERFRTLITHGLTKGKR